MRESILKTKSFALAIRIVKLFKFLKKEHQEFVLSKQLLRSGTSVGALIRESEHAESPTDFIHKLSISLKETNESLYWLELLFETDYLTKEQFESINTDAIEMIKLLTTSIKTAKSKLK